MIEKNSSISRCRVSQDWTSSVSDSNNYFSSGDTTHTKAYNTMQYYVGTIQGYNGYSSAYLYVGSTYI